MPPFTLDSITTNRATLPPRVVIYGDHGIGKTTFGASAPDPIVLRTEDGLAGIRVPTFPMAKSYQDVVNAISSLLGGEHPFRTLVIDSLDWLEPLIWTHTATINHQPSIEAFGYGKGYVEADVYWREFLDGLDALRAQGMIVILLAHSTITRFNAPDTESYDRYDIKLHKRAAALVQEWADVVGFVHFETTTVSEKAGFNNKTTRGIATGRRLLSVEERPAYEAKNRFDLPADLDFPKKGAWDVFANACSGAYADDEPTDEQLFGADVSGDTDAGAQNALDQELAGKGLDAQNEYELAGDGVALL